MWPVLSLVKQLRLIRQAQKKTLRQLAEATGISHQFISDIERGKKSPSLLKLELLAKSLNHKIILAPDQEDH